MSLGKSLKVSGPYLLIPKVGQVRLQCFKLLQGPRMLASLLPRAELALQSGA